MKEHFGSGKLQAALLTTDLAGMGLENGIDSKLRMTREDFNTAVFERDDHKCVLCGDEAVDAHHIIDRKLFEDGGYKIENGASVCPDCHWDCELTVVHPEDVRRAAGIENRILPKQASKDEKYDKWLNVRTGELDRDGRKIYFQGPLYESDAFQKNLERMPWRIRASRVYI